MVRAVALVALVCATVGAAPVPPPSEKELIAKHWGKTQGAGEFSLKGTRLTLRAAENGATDLRVVRTVRGDFTVEVLVEAACPDPTKEDSAEPRSDAGLFVAGGDYRLNLFLYQAYHRGDDKQLQKTPQRSVWVDRFHPNGGSGSNLKDVAAGQALHLRVVRAGKDVAVAYKLAGKEWAESAVEANKTDFPDEVTIGVYLTHTTRQPLYATFDKFIVTTPKK